MADFINTVDVLGDSAVLDSIIDGTITEFRDNNIKTIGAGAFRDCTALETVCFPNATAIMGGAFRGSGLKAITPEMFPKVTRFTYMYGSRVFGDSMLETVEFPSLVELGEPSLFNNSPALRSVSLPNLSALGTYVAGMFCDCKSLTNVNMPKAPRVGSWFERCSSLKEVTFPLASSVDGGAFRDATALRIVDLPVCVTINGGYTFSGDLALKAIILRSETMCTLASVSNVFNNSGIANGTCYVYVPRELLPQYASASNWSTFGSSIFRALEDYTVDGTITGALDEDKI